jgi:DtxR family Mn-dependent transcriptional regulator
MSKQISKPLTDIEKDGKFVVDSISDRDGPLLKRLKAHGITPGALLQVLSRSKEEFVLRVGTSKALHLSRALASAVRIRSADLARGYNE